MQRMQRNYDKKKKEEKEIKQIKRGSSYLSLNKGSKHRVLVIKNSLSIGIYRYRINFTGYCKRVMADKQITRAERHLEREFQH